VPGGSRDVLLWALAGPSIFLKAGVNEGVEVAMAHHSTNFGGRGVARLDDDKRWDRSNGEAGGDTWLIFDVDLGDLDVRSLSGNFVQQRGDHLARCTPGGPEIQEYRDITVGHFRFKIV
jgi:hypothetical protein